MSKQMRLPLLFASDALIRMSPFANFAGMRANGRPSWHRHHLEWSDLPSCEGLSECRRRC